MKVILACSQGGHITEILLLIKAFEGHELIFIIYDNPANRDLGYKTYKIEYIGLSLKKMLKAFPKIFKILLQEKPQYIVSMGSEIAIPTFLLAKLLRIKTIYIESWCRVTTKSGTGKILYFIADVFLVQWLSLTEKYGRKAKYEGSII